MRFSRLTSSKIRTRKLVTILAMRLSSVNSSEALATQDIDTLRYSAKMLRVAATGVLAEMVNNQSFWYGAKIFLVDDSMG